MSKKTLSDGLKQLISEGAERSKTARLRDVIDEVEEALAAGIPQPVILERLKKGGLDMSLEVFRNALYRIRKSRGGKPEESKPKHLPDQAAPKRTQPAKPREIEKRQDEEDSENTPSSNPIAAIDKIIGSTPDLEALTKAAKLNRTKK